MADVRARVEKIRARLDHPIVDSDGHTIEFEPAVLDYLEKLAGPSMVERYRKASGDGLMGGSERNRRASAARSASAARPGGWCPRENTLDRATASLPRLLVSRLEELGLDFSVVYPSIGLIPVGFEDAELRQASCRAFNALPRGGLYREHARWLAPVAIIPMHTPAGGGGRARLRRRPARLQGHA